MEKELKYYISPEGKEVLLRQETNFLDTEGGGEGVGGVDED